MSGTRLDKVKRPVSALLAVLCLGAVQGVAGPQEEAMNPDPRDHQINYVEFPTTDIESTKAFYSEVFGWKFTDWGPDYVSFEGAGLDGGFRLVDAVETGGPLVILYHHDLRRMVELVEKSGGTIMKPIFDFPGGSRFEFTDPTGNTLAVWSERPGS